MDRPSVIEVIQKGFAPTLAEVKDLMAWALYLEAENGERDELRKRVEELEFANDVLREELKNPF